MTLNTILIIVCLGIFILFLLTMFIYFSLQKDVKHIEDYETFDDILEGVKNHMVDLVKEDYTLEASDEDYMRLMKRKAKIEKALKRSAFGIDSEKALVKDLIVDFLKDNVPLDNIKQILNLDENSEPDIHVMFEILMLRFKKEYGKNAMKEWMKKYHLDEERPYDPTDDTNYDISYYITEEDLQYTYVKEEIELEDEEIYQLMSTLLFEQYKGFGDIDTIREMNIDGINCGASGSFITALSNDVEVKSPASKSTWINFEGKYIHLRFVDFKTEDELRRIIQMLIRWNSPGSLSAKRGYIVNTMYDKSRIYAVRPPVSGYWAFFIRKFTLSSITLDFLVMKDYVKGGLFIARLVEYLVKGEVTCAITGGQGSGKSTFMEAMINYLDPRYTIRVLEMAPELYLNELYPERNTLAVQETQTVTASEAQDGLKKSDGNILLVGEVATDEVALRMLQMGAISYATYFTHHAVTTKDLVLALRNSAVNAGGFTSMTTAEKQVTDIIKVNIHLEKSASGKRYVDYIEEIVQLEEGIPYPEYDEEHTESINKAMHEYFVRQTDRQSFVTRRIIEYDIETDTYIPMNHFSPQLEKRMKSKMPKLLKEEFELMLEGCWDSKRDIEWWNSQTTSKRKSKKITEKENDTINPLANNLTLDINPEEEPEELNLGNNFNEEPEGLNLGNNFNEEPEGLNLGNNFNEEPTGLKLGGYQDE